MADEASEVVRLRHDFYRDGYRKLVGILLFSILIVVILASSLAYIVTHPPAPKYFATDSTGRIIPLVALNQPNMSTPAILQWANTAAVAAFSYNFVNYRKELQAASTFFTPAGWEAFESGLKDSNNLDAVIAKKLVVSAVATGAPVVLQKGVIAGRYSWRVQMPLLVTYQSAGGMTQQQLILKMLITRISTLNSARGIGIAQFIATPSGEAGGLTQ